MSNVKNVVKKGLRALGFRIPEKTFTSKWGKIAIELDADEADIIKYVKGNRLTMTGLAECVNTLKSCKYAVENNIPGDFVECGVWRGGHGILAKKVFELLGSDKKVWMFDTFEGMTEPTKVDVYAISKKLAKINYDNMKTATHNEWCYASLEDVKNNCISSGLNLEAFNFVKGDVLQTLSIGKNLPKQICILRLDTDWYESTKAELEVLYPLLSKQGVLIIDDYGAWEGSRKAVDEYFDKTKYKPLFNVVNEAARSAIKC